MCQSVLLLALLGTSEIPPAAADRVVDRRFGTGPVEGQWKDAIAGRRSWKDGRRGVDEVIMQVPLRLCVSSILLAAGLAAVVSLLDMASLLRTGLHLSIKTSLTSQAARLSPYLAFRTQSATASPSVPRTPSRPFSSTSHFHSSAPTAVKMSAQPFLDAVAQRRSYYPLKKESPISDARIQEIIKQTLLHVPSSFNSQTTRIVLLVKKEHDKLWDIVKDVLKGVTPGDFTATQQKIDLFKGAYGTVLFFNHRPTIQGMQKNFALYADKFPIWADQSAGMHEFAIWTALEAEGLGANLQHYNPIIDQKVAAEWKIDETWELNAQLVFGTPTGPAGEKAFKPVEGERFLTFGV